MHLRDSGRVRMTRRTCLREVVLRRPVARFQRTAGRDIGAKAAAWNKTAARLEALAGTTAPRERTRIVRRIRGHFSAKRVGLHGALQTQWCVFMAGLECAGPEKLRQKAGQAREAGEKHAKARRQADQKAWRGWCENAERSTKQAANFAKDEQPPCILQAFRADGAETFDPREVADQAVEAWGEIWDNQGNYLARREAPRGDRAVGPDEPRGRKP